VRQRQAPGPRAGDAVAAGALRCAAAAAALILLVASAVRIAGLADDTRELLGFGFGGIAGGAVAGVEIALDNAQIATAALVAALFAPRAGPFAIVLDILLGGLLVLNASIVGVALGAYGDGLLAAVWPHAPLELTAFSLAGGSYMAARHRRLPARTLAGAAAAVGLLLLAAGLLEATVSNPR
jgi:uncharacterized membrane protein SpoIIM required for sporulation